MADNPDGGDRATAQEGAPHGITLFDHAEIAAQLAEGDRPLAVLLEARGLTESQWNEASIFWMTRMGDDVRKHAQDARIPHVYSDAFSKAQDALKPPPSMDAASYAKLVVDIQAAGGPAQPLAVRGLSLADYLRLSRHMARVLSTDAAQAKVFFEMYQRLQSAGQTIP
ncbi:hypothetical protein [Sorangium sp. So ce388]|uniref:hypothetical protein n=1 Tax=Sorangium sp. So ce388 TaxID=3133309 RepID=UPI003F5B1228